MLFKLSKQAKSGKLPTLTPNNLYFKFQEYLITWINIITKERSLYPLESFEDRNSFNLKVPFNRHPKVQEWVETLVGDLMSDLTFKNVHSVKLIIYDEYSGEVTETYSLELQEFLHVEVDFYDKEIKDLDVSWESLIDEFRGNLYTLLHEIRKLPPLNPVDDTISTPRDIERSWKFNVLLETSNVSLNKSWILDKSTTPINGDDSSKVEYALNMDSEAMVSSTPDDNEQVKDHNNNKMIPLQVVDIGPIVFFSSISVNTL